MSEPVKIVKNPTYGEAVEAMERENVELHQRVSYNEGSGGREGG